MNGRTRALPPTRRNCDARGHAFVIKRPRAGALQFQWRDERLRWRLKKGNQLGRSLVQHRRRFGLGLGFVNRMRMLRIRRRRFATVLGFSLVQHRRRLGRGFIWFKNRTPPAAEGRRKAFHLPALARLHGCQTLILHHLPAIARRRRQLLHMLPRVQLAGLSEPRLQKSFVTPFERLRFVVVSPATASGGLRRASPASGGLRRASPATASRRCRALCLAGGITRN